MQPMCGDSLPSPFRVSVVNELRPHVIVEGGGPREGRDGDHDLRDGLPVQVQAFDHPRPGFGIYEEGFRLVGWRYIE